MSEMMMSIRYQPVSSFTLLSDAICVVGHEFSVTALIEFSVTALIEFSLTALIEFSLTALISMANQIDQLLFSFHLADSGYIYMT